MHLVYYKIQDVLHTALYDCKIVLYKIIVLYLIVSCSMITKQVKSGLAAHPRAPCECLENEARSESNIYLFSKKIFLFNPPAPLFELHAIY